MFFVCFFYVSFVSVLEFMFDSVESELMFLEVGSVLRTLCVLSSSIPWQLVATLLIMLAWTFLSTLVNFRGGPYAYAGFCAAFTAIKFLSSTGPGGIQLSTTITSSMWACGGLRRKAKPKGIQSQNFICCFLSF